MIDKLMEVINDLNDKLDSAYSYKDEEGINYFSKRTDMFFEMITDMFLLKVVDFQEYEKLSNEYDKRKKIKQKHEDIEFWENYEKDRKTARKKTSKEVKKS